MAQDPSYQTTVYEERGGDRHVAGSGGTFAVESGGSILVANSGTVTIASGAALSIIAGATIGLAGADVEVDDMRRVLASEWGAAVEIGTGTTVATESIYTQSNLPKNARMVTLLGAVSASVASFWLTSVSAGREVFLRLVGDSTGAFTTQETRVSVNASGCLILNSLGGAIATLALFTSTNSNCAVHLVAPFDDVWAVVSELGKITES